MWESEANNKPAAGRYGDGIRQERPHRRLAFVSIGLETNFRALANYFKGGKTLVLYVAGQSFNLCLTLLMAWLMFEKVFPEAAEILKK